MTATRPKRFHNPLSPIAEVALALATLPALGVGVAAYSLNFDAIRLVAWMFGADERQLWAYFRYYALTIFLVWVLVGVLSAWRERT